PPPAGEGPKGRRGSPAKSEKGLAEARENRDPAPPPLWGRLGGGLDMDSDQNFSPSKAIEQARRLRQEATKAERLLWSRLRSEKTGCKFRRQHPCGEYVLDFF